MSLISVFLDHTRITNWLQLLHCLLSLLFYPFTPTREVKSQLLVFGEHIWKKNSKQFCFFFKFQIENNFLGLGKFIALELVWGWNHSFLHQNTSH